MQNKVKALGRRKKTIKQVVSSDAPRHCDDFPPWFRIDGQINGNLMDLQFWKGGCSLLDD